jgi:hypothetical protein
MEAMVQEDTKTRPTAAEALRMVRAYLGTLTHEETNQPVPAPEYPDRDIDGEIKERLERKKRQLARKAVKDAAASGRNHSLAEGPTDGRGSIASQKWTRDIPIHWISYTIDRSLRTRGS